MNRRELLQASVAAVALPCLPRAAPALPTTRPEVKGLRAAIRLASTICREQYVYVQDHSSQGNSWLTRVDLLDFSPYRVQPGDRVLFVSQKSSPLRFQATVAWRFESPKSVLSSTAIYNDQTLWYWWLDLESRRDLLTRNDPISEMCFDEVWGRRKPNNEFSI